MEVRVWGWRQPTACAVSRVVCERPPPLALMALGNSIGSSRSEYPARLPVCGRCGLSREQLPRRTGVAASAFIRSDPDPVAAVGHHRIDDRLWGLGVVAVVRIFGTGRVVKQRSTAKVRP